MKEMVTDFIPDCFVDNSKILGKYIANEMKQKLVLGLWLGLGLHLLGNGQ